MFFNLYACDAGHFTTNKFIAGEWVFGTDMGLLAVASAKSGGMSYSMDVYYDALGDGETFGQAMQDWWTAVGAYGFDSYELPWSYGMTVIGDPLLVSQEYVTPEPATLVMLALGGVAIIRRRRA